MKGEPGDFGPQVRWTDLWVPSPPPVSRAIDDFLLPTLLRAHLQLGIGAPVLGPLRSPSWRWGVPSEV